MRVDKEMVEVFQNIAGYFKYTTFNAVLYDTSLTRTKRLCE